MLFANLRIYLYGALAIALVGGVFYYGHSRYESGVESERAVWTEKLRLAEEKSKNETQQLQKTVNESSIKLQDYENKLTAISADYQKRLRNALAARGNDVIPGVVVRVLDDSEHPIVSHDAGSTSQPSPTTPAPDSTLGEQLNICERNYQERYLPLAEQMRQLQQLWLDTQKLINNDHGIQDK